MMVIVSYGRKKIDDKERRQSHKQYNDTHLGWGEWQNQYNIVM